MIDTSQSNWQKSAQSAHLFKVYVDIVQLSSTLFNKWNSKVKLIFWNQASIKLQNEALNPGSLFSNSGPKLPRPKLPDHSS